MAKRLRRPTDDPGAGKWRIVLTVDVDADDLRAAHDQLERMIAIIEHRLGALVSAHGGPDRIPPGAYAW